MKDAVSAVLPSEEETMNRSPYSLGFTTLASETSVEELPIRGQVPTWLTGTLVRTGPARFEVGSQTYNHWFDGLAMLHKFAFAAGRVSYANRYPGEPVFVAVPQTANEDQGVILSVVLDTREGASLLLVLDASTFRELARADVPHHIPFGIHGDFFTPPAADERPLS